MMIEKEAKTKRQSNIFFTASCRNSLFQLLEGMNSDLGGILLPAYIGLSNIEGSGVLDPVIEADFKFAFYRLNDKLQPELENLEGNIQTFMPQVVLFINYFGFEIAEKSEIQQLSRKYNFLTIEDNAHNINGLCRNESSWSDFEIYSIHKSTESSAGGILIDNRKNPHEFKNNIKFDDLLVYTQTNLGNIERIRNRNYLRLYEYFINSNFDDWRMHYESNRMPKSSFNFPIRLKSPEIRNELYQYLAEHGIATTALYHRLVNQIQASEFSESHTVANTILNLPVHQDIQEDQMAQLIAKLESFSQSTAKRT